MRPIPNLELVLIIPDKVEDTIKIGDKELEKSDVQKENEKKAQNRGKIFAVGNKVEFWEKGDYVSFYKAASTPVVEDGVTYYSINQGNILVKFVTDVQG